MANYTSFSDQELIVLMYEGNEQAFTEIYYRYWKTMFYIAAKKSGDLQDAEEIVQEIFLDLWKRRSQLKIENELHVYLAVAVKYKVINLLAKRKRMFQYQASAKNQSQLADRSTEDWLSFEEMKDQLEKLVAHLPEKCKLVYTLSREEGYSQKKISQLLHISEKTVEAHLTRALKSIRKGIFQCLLFSIAFITASAPLLSVSL